MSGAPTVSGEPESRIEIRPMTVSDLARVNELHRVAFRGSLSAMLGRRYHAWIVATAGAVSLVAVAGGRIVGFTHGAPRGYSSRLHRELAWSAVAAAAVRPWSVLQLGFVRQLSVRLGFLYGRAPRDADRAVTGQPPSAGFTGICIAVDPVWRGRGVGRRLLATRSERAFALGYDRLTASVSEKNLPSRRLFEGLGWRPLGPGRTIIYLLDRHVPPRTE